MFCSIYGETADSVQALFDNSHPDLGEVAFYQLFSVFKAIRDRMVYQYHLLWSDVRVYRRSLPYRNIVYPRGERYCER